MLAPRAGLDRVLRRRWSSTSTRTAGTVHYRLPIVSVRCEAQELQELQERKGASGYRRTDIAALRAFSPGSGYVFRSVVGDRDRGAVALVAAYTSGRFGIGGVSGASGVLAWRRVVVA